MLPRTLHVVLVLLPASPAVAQPLSDHHQHLFSPAVAALISPAPPAKPVAPISAADLIQYLDDAGIKRAAVLSMAYGFGSPLRAVENERQKVIAENDWTASQVAQFPERLLGFCGVNPLKDYALEEVARCAGNPNLRRGLKLHFANSRVDYHSQAHIAQVGRVFRAANEARMAIVVHVRNDDGTPYGRNEALIFLNEILPAAPDVPVQIAHLAGSRGNPASDSDQALGVFVDAIQKGDPRTSQLWFDVAPAAAGTLPPERKAVLARRIRELGVRRVLYGSDSATPDNRPVAVWTEFRTLPLTDEELRTISSNVPPYMR